MSHNITLMLLKSKDSVSPDSLEQLTRSLNWCGLLGFTYLIYKITIYNKKFKCLSNTH